MADVSKLPQGLAAPQDDGACKHLVGMQLPDLSLQATTEKPVFLKEMSKECLVIYCYPMTGRPDRNLPENWDSIPGARGCTPQSCSFRDHYEDLKSYGAKVYGLSTQSTSYQQEAKQRLHLPFELLSDETLSFVNALNLPTVDLAQISKVSPDIPTILIKRLTLIAREGKIEKVFYPVFPPDQDAQNVLNYLEQIS